MSSGLYRITMILLITLPIYVHPSYIPASQFHFISELSSNFNIKFCLCSAAVVQGEKNTVWPLNDLIL